MPGPRLKTFLRGCRSAWASWADCRQKNRNAAEHFEKGKRQNQLRSEHIDRIIDTYQFRKEEPRYSRRVNMGEISQNDFNLNISRYVSMAVAEEDVDLAAVHGRMIEIEKDIKEARDKHNGFPKQLGLPPLPGSGE